MHFDKYPFEKLRDLLSDVCPEMEGNNLSIGEPSFSSPLNVIKSVEENAYLIRYYPKILPDLKISQINFVKNRFNIALEEEEIISTFGSREAIFNFTQYLMSTTTKNKIAFPNPFYQIYEGAAIAAKSQTIYMPINKENNFKPSLNRHNLKKVGLVILNSPNNPTGQVLTLKELEEWVQLALDYNFYLINDECYSEIYMDKKPNSILEASYNIGNKDFRNIFTINSISKRVCAPGLRSGFVAGDKSILKEYSIYRSYAGLSIPNTLQHASIEAWNSYEYAEQIRKKFATNLAIAKKEFPDVNIAPYSFYVWLNVQDCKEIHLNDRLFNDELFTRQLYREYGHVVLPGSYLGKAGAGAGYVRIALTKNENITKIALENIKDFRDSFMKRYSCDV